jgi:hypothetical protein
MNSDRRRASWLGALLISGIAFGILNTVPALEYPDYLAKLSTIRTQVLIAVFFQAAMATAYVCIAVLFYPVVKRHSKGLALGYFGFRIIGATFLFVGIGSLLLLLQLSGSLVSAGLLDAPQLQIAGELLRVGRDIMNHVAFVLPWVLGGLILCWSMFKTKSVPRWLSAWGIVGSVLSLIATLLLMLGFIEMMTPTYMAMNTPTALFELSLAVFLLVRGFNPLVANSDGSRGSEESAGIATPRVSRSFPAPR